MSGVQNIRVDAGDDGVRIDRWLKNRFPAVGHGRIQKWLRTGQVRVDGGRAKPADRLETGQTVRVPPMAADTPAHGGPKKAPRKAVTADLGDYVIAQDDWLMAINKPPGLAVQGGSGISDNVDDQLASLVAEGADKPRLVHRLDKDTSGVLVVARTATAARTLTGAFRDKSARKVYWALVVGVPAQPMGKIDATLSKGGGAGRERMQANQGGKDAVTRYRTLATSPEGVSLLELEPLTGRTHQLRVHCADVLGTPILGDGKYGGRGAFVDGGFARRLHLHARSISVPHPNKGQFEAVAEPPAHFLQALAELGFANQW